MTLARTDPTEQRRPKTAWGTLREAVSMPWHCYVWAPVGEISGQALVKCIYLNIEVVKLKQAYFTITLILPTYFHA